MKSPSNATAGSFSDVSAAAAAAGTGETGLASATSELNDSNKHSTGTLMLLEGRTRGFAGKRLAHHDRDFAGRLCVHVHHM